MGDICWLACAGVRLYGQQIYPKGNYKPSILRIGSASSILVPHPRKKIQDVINMKTEPKDIPIIYVEVFKDKLSLTDKHI